MRTSHIVQVNLLDGASLDIHTVEVMRASFSLSLVKRERDREHSIIVK